LLKNKLTLYNDGCNEFEFNGYEYHIEETDTINNNSISNNTNLIFKEVIFNEKFFKNEETGESIPYSHCLACKYL
jgi:hypothetical protein